MDQVVERARRFNRFYARAAGALEAGGAGCDFTPAEARVIEDLTQRPRAPAPEVGAALDLDPGYLSRILKRLEAQGLVERVPEPDDRRQRRLSLTAHGQDAFAAMDGGARDAMAGLIGPLGPDGHERLSVAMAEIETLLSPGAKAEVVLRERRPGDLCWIVERHGRLYAEEQGWDARYETGGA